MCENIFRECSALDTGLMALAYTPQRRKTKRENGQIVSSAVVGSQAGVGEGIYGSFMREGEDVPSSLLPLLQLRAVAWRCTVQCTVI